MTNPEHEDWQYHLIAPWPLGAAPGAARWRPHCDVYETADEAVIVVEIAGMRREEIELAVEGSRVVVRGSRRRPAPHARKHYHRLEISAGPFEATFELPCSFDGDRVRATYQEGLLRVVLPKSDRPRGGTVSVRLEWA